MILSNVKFAKPQSAESGIVGSLKAEIQDRWKASWSGPAGRGAIMGLPSIVARAMSILIPHAQINHAKGDTPVISGLYISGFVNFPGISVKFDAGEGAAAAFV